ncbi:MAG: metal ABC transporter permease [Verrucomicrobia bacterium]|nr:MAG: metal ABC transporter permease [Verrucomicrobiota bacterium]
MWDVMMWPILACVLLPGLLVYLGLHVVRRGIIFIDIAMAQMASLGVCFAVMKHMDPDSPMTFWISLGFTLLAAALFAFTGKRNGEVPQEAIIGIAYVVAAAASVILLSYSTEGDEQIKNMLIGNILLVTKEEIFRTLGLFVGVGLFHWFLRKPFLMLSFAPAQAAASGMRVKLWDFLFYATFGLVVTSFVQIVGVLLVFTYLIVPAVCGILTARRFGARLAIGIVLSLIGGVTGLILSFYEDLPSGAAIVCVFGALLVLAAGVGMVVRPKAGGRRDVR